MAISYVGTNSDLVPSLVYQTSNGVGSEQDFLVVEPNLTFRWDTSANQIVLDNETGQSVSYSLQGQADAGGFISNLNVQGSVTQGSVSEFYLNGSAVRSGEMDMDADGDVMWATYYMSAVTGLKVIKIHLGRLASALIPRFELFTVS